jgi:cytochrome P450
MRVHPQVVIHRSDPFIGYRKLHQLGTLFPTTYGGYIACGHAAVSAVLRDPRLHVQVPYADAFGLETAHLTSAAMSFANGADHTRRRGFMAKAFQPKVLAELEPRLIELVDELLGALARKRSADFVADLALPFPVRVIAEMLGVPRDAHAQCTEWSEALAPLVDAALTRERFQKVYDAGRDFSAFMLGLMEERRRRPARDIITTLVRALDEQGELTELEVVSNLITLFVAGHETTTNLLSASVVHLDQHAEARASLEADPALLGPAVEEVLRFAPALHFTSRVAPTALELQGQPMAAGEVVWVMIAAANRDAAVFAEPDRFDIHRSPNPHISFGGGPHACIGLSLARLEAKHALGRFFARFPRWSVAPQLLELRHTVALRGYKRVEVRLR